MKCSGVSVMLPSRSWVRSVNSAGVSLGLRQQTPSSNRVRPGSFGVFHNGRPTGTKTPFGQLFDFARRSRRRRGDVQIEQTARFSFAANQFGRSRCGRSPQRHRNFRVVSLCSSENGNAGNAKETRLRFAAATVRVHTVDAALRTAVDGR